MKPQKKAHKPCKSVDANVVLKDDETRRTHTKIDIQHTAILQHEDTWLAVTLLFSFYTSTYCSVLNSTVLSLNNQQNFHY